MSSGGKTKNIARGAPPLLYFPAASLTVATQSQHEMHSRLCLNVVVRQRAALVHLFACTNESLLIVRNSFFVLHLPLESLHRVSGLNCQSDILARQRLDLSREGRQNNDRRQRMRPQRSLLQNLQPFAVS